MPARGQRKSQIQADPREGWIEGEGRGHKAAHS